MRLIDADKLHNARLMAIRAYENANIFNPKAIRENIKPLLDIIVDTPTINPDDLVKHEEWISVKDRLPEIKRYGTSDIVLAFDKKHGKCFALRYKTREGIKWFCSGTELVDITHWMPLPESPEEEN